LGTYTLALARLVGPRGRVIAVEPMPSTFAFLAANVAFAGFDNVTLLNLAASDRDGPIPISVPRIASDDTENLYQAHVSAEESNSLLVRACRLDNMLGDLPLSFVKIDVEGHEFETLAGMIESLRRFRPRLLVECPSASSVALLEQLGYRASTLPGSPNTWFETESTRGAPDRTS
jgi:FkbM family methyltransferase